MKLLIVDENPAARLLFSQLLHALPDMTLIEAQTSCEALAWSAVHEPDLVLVDYAAPTFNGLHFLKSFRALPRRQSVPVIMVTDAEECSVRNEALQLGANDFLAKPVNELELRARVGSMLRLRSCQLQLAAHDVLPAGEVVKATAEIVAREREAILRLSRAAKYRDPETGAHLLRMAQYAHLIASNLGLPASQRELIMEAAPMHDIGKVGIPDHILLKPGRLDAGELAVMRMHAEIGACILKGGCSPLLQAASAIALTHHERYDGTGYPRGLKAKEIPLLGRIAAVADVFDALTSARPYKPAWSLERAAAFIRDGASNHFDPDCVDAFFSDWSAVLRIHSSVPDEEWQPQPDFLT